MVNEAYWCRECETPLVEKTCSSCDNTGNYLASGLRFVFRKERSMYRQYFVEDGCVSDIPSFLLKSGYQLLYGNQPFIKFTVHNGSLVGKANPIKVNGYKAIENEEFRGGIIKANKDRLHELESEAIEFIRTTVDNNPDREVFVSFSGGKDSAVTAHLVKKALGKAKLFFANTTIEFPETIEYVHDFSTQKGYRLIEYNAPTDFFELMDKLEPPSRMMRWCCSTQKATPINQFYKDVEGNILSFDGIRASESKHRAEYTRVKENTKIIKQLSAYPILNWSDFEVWCYLLHADIPVNPLYTMGYSRVGCWACPNNNRFDSFLLTKTHPQLHEKLNKYLNHYARENNKTRDWVKTGMWKSRKSKYHKTAVCKEEHPCGIPTDMVYRLRKPVSLREMEFLKIFGDYHTDNFDNRQAIQIRGKGLAISTFLGDDKIVVSLAGVSDFNRTKHLIEKQLTKSFNCVNCKACIGSCPNNAIFFDNDNLRIDESKCTNCTICATSKHIKQACVALHYKVNRKSILCEDRYIPPPIEQEVK